MGSLRTRTPFMPEPVEHKDVEHKDVETRLILPLGQSPIGSDMRAASTIRHRGRSLTRSCLLPNS